jgi:hypothetical protein
MYVSRPRRPLYLQPLPDQVQRKYSRLRCHTRHHSCCCVPGAEWKRQWAQGCAKSFIGSKKETHVGYYLNDCGIEPSEEPPWAFMAVYVSYRADKASVHSIVSLGSKPCSEEIKRICCGCCQCTCCCTAGKGLHVCGKALGEVRE